MASYDDTATVSGSVVSFSDGADEVGLKSCVISLPTSLTGYTEASVYKTGKNLFDGFTKGYGLNSNTGKIVETPSGAISGYIPVKEETNYYLSGLTDTLRSFIAYYKADKTYISRTGGTKKLYAALTTPSECAYAIVYQYVETGSSASIDDVDNLQTQLEVGSSASSYEPYKEPTSYTASLGRTIYGGTPDLVNGMGSENTSAPTTLNSRTWNKTTIGGHACFYCALPNGYIGAGGVVGGDCNSYDVTTDGQMGTDRTIRFYCSTSFNFSRCSIRDDRYADLSASEFKAVVDGNIVYQLAESAQTPFTFDPVTIETSKGSNTFWSEQGDSEVTYYKDGYGTTSVTIHKETPDGEPVEETRKLHRIIYEGQVDVISGTGLIYRGESGTQYDPPEQISFTPIEVSTDEGENTLYADEGDSAITYRKAVE